jgi:Ca2+/Na+ antiporter
MEIFLSVLLFGGGLYVIIKGGDFLVDAALKLSKASGISQVIIGATLVSIATTLPEVFVSIFAVSKGNHGIAIGNAVGSMICNVALVLALYITFLPAKVNRRAIYGKSLFLFVITFLVFLFTANLKIGWTEGAILLALFTVFLILNIKEARDENPALMDGNSPSRGEGVAARRADGVVETRHLKYINFGGGHHITREDYDVDGLIKLIKDFRNRYPSVQVYLEPGEAIVLNAGTLTATVLDIVHNQRPIAILDTSAACHNPDILETGHAYTPPIQGAVRHCEERSNPDKTEHLYRLAGNTCLAGDIIGDYHFQNPLKVGDKITFLDTALYTMVKTNMFNGINLPSIYVKRLSGKTELLREFGFEDYISRLGKKK